MAQITTCLLRMVRRLCTEDGVLGLCGMYCSDDSEDGSGDRFDGHSVNGTQW